MKTKLLQFWLRRLALLVIFVTPAVLPVWSINRVVEVNGDGEISIVNKYAVIDVILREANNPRGDVNGDGNISIADVTALIDYLLTGDASNIVFGNADCDLNGNVSISDVTTLIDYLLKGEWPEEEQDYEYVDLGLPSGTLWATCNVGANSPEEYGDYFAWGETEPKDFYDLSTYKWIDSSNMLIKYCTDSDYGTIDNKTELDPEDDAAYMNLGVLWRMPSSEQFQELCDECTWTWTTKSGVNGQLVTGPNGNTLFFPAAGYWFGSSIGGLGSRGHYWSCDLYIGYQYDACYIFFDSGNYGLWYRSRDYGRTVRAVRASQEPVQFQLSETEVSLEVGESKTVDILNGSGSYTVDGGTDCVSSTFNGNQLILTGISEGTAELIVTDVTTQANASIFVSVTDSDTIQFDHEWVDLGLPSGTLWATCNVGANAPEEYGDYFAWGETEPKDYYDGNTYKWCNNGDYYQLTKYCTKSEYGYNGFVDNKSELDPEDDAAYVNWGENWRMPTYDQQKELLNKCTWTWTTQNGVNGYLVTGSNSASLFLPAAGSRWSDYLASAGTYGEYWSRPLDSTHPCNADIIGFNSDERGIWHVDRNIGHSVRAVRVSQN